MYGFQASAFQNTAFQHEILSGGGSGSSGGSESSSTRGYDPYAFQDAYRNMRKVMRDEKVPEKVYEAVKEVAAVNIDKPKKERGKILRSRIRDMDMRVNTLYLVMLENLVTEYNRLAEEIELEERQQYQQDMAIILLLLS